MARRRRVRIDWRWVALLLALAMLPAAAHGVFRITADGGEFLLRQDVRVLAEGPGAPLSVEQAVARIADALPHRLSPPNMGRSTRPVWGFVTLQNDGARRDWVLGYTLSTIEDIQFFVRRPGQNFERLAENGQGAIWPLTGQSYPNVAVTLAPGESLDIAVRLHTRIPVGFHLWLIDPPHFHEAERRRTGIAAFLTAVPIVVALHVLLLWGALRRAEHGYFLGFQFCQLVLNAWVSGFGPLLLPAVPRGAWPDIAFPCVALVPLFAWLHARRFLAWGRVADRVLGAMAALMAALAVVELLGVANTRSAVQAMAAAFSLAMAAMAIRGAMGGAASRLAFAAGWVLVAAVGVVQVARLLVLITWDVRELVYAQAAVSMLLFGVALFRELREREAGLTDSLRASNARFALMIRGAAAAMYHIGLRGGRLEGAAGLSRLLGAPHAASLPRLLARLPRPERRRLLAAVRQALAAGDAEARFATEVMAADGRSLLVSGAIGRDAQGRPETLSGSVTDITSERALSRERALGEQLAEAKGRAEAMLAARTRLFATVHHDLRHPLLALGLYIDMLDRNPAEPRLREMLPRMREAQASAAGFVAVAAEMAAEDNALEMQPRIAAVALAPLLESLAQRFRPVAGQAGLELRLVTRDAVAMTDPALLERMLSNLLDNALRYTEAGGVLLGIRRGCGAWLLDVYDTGIGMTAAEAEQAHEDGIRLRPDLAAGAGLGLGIVQRLAAMLGHAVALRSQPGRGTRVRLVLRDEARVTELRGASHEGG